MAEHTCPQCLALNAADAIVCIECGATLTDSLSDAVDPAPSDDFKPGEIINDRYSIIKLIGRGGMGSIYKVHDRVLDEDLAFKVLLPNFAADQEIVDRFINEVRITRKIAHPNIVRVHDFGTMDDRMFISMEYVDGESLREKLDILKKGVHLPLRQALHIISQLCIALKYAHHFTIHRDIKPDNIMITRGNNIKLMDFGISKLHDKRHESTDTSVVGTPYYMAPEQMCNLPDIDSRADIYSVGVVMYELLTGGLPGNIPQPISQLNDETPLELDAVVMKCLAPERDKRYNNASELREALRPVIEGLHFSSSSGGGSSKDSGSDASSLATPAIGTFGDVIQAFSKDSQDGGGGVQPDVAYIQHISSSDSDMASDIKASDVLQNFTFDKPKTAVPTPRTNAKTEKNKKSTSVIDFFTNTKTIVVAIVFVCIIVIYLVHAQTAGEYTGTDRPTEQISELGSIGGLVPEGMTVVETYLEALKNKGGIESFEQKKRMDALRDLSLKNIETRAFGKPYSKKNLSEASTDITKLSNKDSNPKVLQLREQLNREVAFFKFMLIKIDTVEERREASFTLNNSFLRLKTQTVVKGDLLMDRFLVQGITQRTVSLKDISEKGRGRYLRAEKMQEVKAE